MATEAFDVILEIVFFRASLGQTGWNSKFRSRADSRYSQANGRGKIPILHDICKRFTAIVSMSEEI